MSPARAFARVAWRSVVIGMVVFGRALIAVVPVTAIALVHGRERARADLLERLVVTLERLGPTFIKCGQLLGTRRDVLPLDVCDALSRLQDRVPPIEVGRAQRQMARLFGDHLSEIFSTFDYEPIASGSVASVYRATSAGDDRALAVKLKRPGIDAMVDGDLRLIRAVGRLVARAPQLEKVPVTEMLDQLCETVAAQLDFVRESQNLVRLRRTLREVPRIWVPKLDAATSRAGVVVMEYIPDLDVETAQRCSPVLRRRMAASTLAATYEMLFVDGFVHCDMHPGNLYFSTSGRVIILDAGFVVKLSERMRRLFAEFFLNMSVGRGTKCAEIVISSAAKLEDDADIETFTEELTDLVERSSGVKAGNFSLIAFAVEMFDIQRRHGVSAASELVFPLLALLVIEGTVRDLDPECDFQESARPVLNRALFGT